MIDNAKNILSSFNSVQIKNIKLNNGFHALDIERSLDLYNFLKKDLKVKFKKIPTARYLMINKNIIKENQKISDYPISLKKYFIKTNIITDDINIIFKSLSQRLQLLIMKVSKRYSGNLKDNLSYFIPWFLPFEYHLKSEDEGDKYRNRVKLNKKKTLLAIPKNGLFEALNYYFMQKFKKIGNIKLLMNTNVSFEEKKMILKKNEELKNNFQDFIVNNNLSSSMFVVAKKIR